MIEAAEDQEEEVACTEEEVELAFAFVFVVDLIL